MASSNILQAKNARVYKDGAYLTTITDISLDNTQNTVSREYVGRDDMVTIATSKKFSGSYSRDAFDESWLETIIGRTVSAKVSASNYADEVDTLRGTVSNGVPVNFTFTTPTDANLFVERVTFNAKKIGSFTGGLEVAVRDAGNTTDLAVFSIGAIRFDTNKNEFVSAVLSPESGTVASGAEQSLASNTTYTLQFRAPGTPTGSIELYGNSTDVNPYFALMFEAVELENATYTIDFILENPDGSTYLNIRDTGVVFTSNSMTMSAGDLITESSGWEAKSRQII